MSSTRTVSAPDGWKLLIPSGWATLSTDPGRRNAQIKRLLDRQFAGTARDELISVRVEVDRRLKVDLARAAETGVTQIHALVEPVAGLPVSATLLVAQLYVGTDHDVVDGLGALLGDSAGVLEVENVQIGEVEAMRRRRRALEAAGDDTGAPEIWHTHLDYVVQISPEDLLVLSFTTSTDPLADELIFVFDSIAGTLHRGDGEIEWDATPYVPVETATAEE